MVNMIEEVLDAERRIAAHKDDRGDVRCVIIQRAYKASVEEVWDSCTSPERISRWFLPVSGDLYAGGQYQLQGNAGGTILRCDPPTNFSASWEYGGEVSWIELRLHPREDDTTLLELIHTVPVNEKWAAFGPGGVGPGWDLALVGLAACLQSQNGGSGVSPGWIHTDEGVKCIRFISEAWYEANLEAGADSATARVAAERTTAFWSTPAIDSVTHVGKPR